MKPVVFSILMLTVAFAHAQKLPPIGSEKGVKEKFMMIKKGLPDIKKNLTKKDEMWENEYNVKFEMGNGIVIFRESEDDQTLTISFSSDPYFSGTIADFQNYYKKLVSIIGEVFGPAYIQDSKNKEKSWTTSFLEKGKDIFSSNISIFVEISWVLSSPDITIEIVSKKPFTKA
jgi:hypothetical protein